MNNFTKLVIGMIAVCGALELLLWPGMFLIAGIAILFILWGLQGGMTEGNPYKRMHYSGLPDFVEVKDYMRKEDIEKRDNADTQTTLAFALLGAGLIGIDLAIMWHLGWF